MRPVALTRFVLPAWLVVVTIYYAATLALFDGRGSGAALPGFALFGVSLFGGAMLLDSLRIKHQRLTDRLRDLMVNDGGAGLLDRRGVERILDIEVERAGRSGVPFALITAAMDREDLHSVDAATAGRAAGVALAVARSVRSIDFAGRMSANLFCVLAIYTDERGAEAMVERIRPSVAEAGDPGAAPPMSFGIAIYGRHGVSSEDLLEAAESGLDEARRLGGERSIIAPFRAHPPEDAESLRNPRVRIAARA